MASIRISPDRLEQVQAARKQRKLAIESPKWLIEASQILKPGTKFEQVSIGTWKRFLRGKAVRKECLAFCQILGLEWQDMAATVEITPPIANYDLGEAADPPINKSGKMTTTINRSNYIDLLNELQIIPKVIEAEVEYDLFLAVTESLLFKRQSRTPEETVLFMLLVKLIEDYIVNKFSQMTRNGTVHIRSIEHE